MSADKQKSAPLPVRGSLRGAYAASVLIAVLTASACIAGLLYPETLYPADDLYRSFLPNDAVTLLIGLPILIGSMLLTARGRLTVLLFWPEGVLPWQINGGEEVLIRWQMKTGA